MLDQIVNLDALGEQFPLLFPFTFLLAALAGTSQISLLWLLFEAAALVLVSYGAYLFYARNPNPTSLLGYLRFAFPGSAYLTKTPVQDLQMLVGNAFVFRFAEVLRFAATLGVGFAIQRLLNRTFGSMAFAPSSETARMAAQFGLTLAVYLVNDFSDFIVHYASHRVPCLWAFHRVHHSGEVLTPLTGFREHPVTIVLNNSAAILMGSVVQGLALYLMPTVATLPLLLTGNLLAYVVLRTNFLLSHFTVPISYGVIEHVLVSPKLHRVHHGRAARYHDKNFGGRLTVWDRLFGTFYMPTNEEAMEMAVGLEGEEHFKTLNPLPLYFEPFISAWRSLRPTKKAAPVGDAVASLPRAPSPVSPLL